MIDEKVGAYGRRISATRRQNDTQKLECRGGQNFRELNLDFMIQVMGRGTFEA
jgi:hypothetical protein